MPGLRLARVSALLLAVLCARVAVAETSRKLIVGVYAMDNAKAQMLGAKFIRLWDFRVVLTVANCARRAIDPATVALRRRWAAGVDVEGQDESMDAVRG